MMINLSKFAAYKYSLLLVFLGLSQFAKAQVCVDLEIPSLPFSISSSTCGEGFDTGWNNVCNAWALTGEDVVYTFTTTDESCVFIELSGFSMGAAVVTVSTTCPFDLSGNCLGTFDSNFNETTVSGTVATQENSTYYITISSDSWIADCMDFNLSVSSDCPAPNVNDCLGAINMCDGYFYEENAPTGNGNYSDQLPFNGCQMTTVANMGWYQLTVETSGILNFTLTPNSDDDYDWILFNMTDATCADLAVNPTLVVGCNTFGLFGANSTTGISSANGGTGTANGPGDLNGPAFNADLNVEAGETYVLMISNWSATTNGYELDFGASTAVFVDNTPPEVESVNYSCEGTLSIVFSEYIDCATVLPEYFTLEGPGGPYLVADIESPCDQGTEYGNGFTITYNSALPVGGGNFNLVFEANELTDVCGNFLEPVTIPIDVPPGMELEVTTSPAGCSQNSGSLSIEVISGGAAPFLYSIDGVAFQSESTFTDLAEGEYTVTIKDNIDCTGSVTATIEIESLEFTAGPDAFTCSLYYSGNASLPTGFTGTWTAPAGVLMSDPTNKNCIFTAPTAGVYDFTWTITNGENCTNSKSVEVTFINLEVANFVFTNPTCHEKCDGSAQVTVSGTMNPDGLTYAWSSGFSPLGSPSSANEVCPGIGRVTITTEEGCTFEFPFLMDNPEPLDMGTINVVSESCPKFCDGSIVIENSEAEEFSFDGGRNFSTASSKENLCSGFYNIVMKNGNACKVETTVVLTQPPGPRARFAAKPNRQSVFTPHFEFENQSENYVSSYWQFDYPNGSATSRLQDASYTYPDPKPGDYMVMLAVVDEDGCTDTTFIQVGLFEDTWVYIPNAFTPNEDGINDFFKPSLQNVDVEDYKFTIFNRWGTKVFETTDVNQGWNGAESGSEYYSEAGMYVYRIHIREVETGEAREWNGTVMLMR